MLLYRQNILRSGKVIDFSADGSIVLDVSSSFRLPETVGKDGWAANLDDPRYASSSSSPSVKLCVPPGACKTLEVFLPVMTLPQFWSPKGAEASVDSLSRCNQVSALLLKVNIFSIFSLSYSMSLSFYQKP